MESIAVQRFFSEDIIYKPKMYTNLDDIAPHNSSKWASQNNENRAGQLWDVIDNNEKYSFKAMTLTCDDVLDDIWYWSCDKIQGALVDYFWQFGFNISSNK